ncbi:NADP-dependent oxidoreductase [Nesterenkonia ebinurensis]|uniref:NADP-dependent oxidoreductase n=1 Tax=Nesterenkonia ebinurensis TaxID=2608252 RepID=UPI001CC657A4|nr:NADP-dependent oxidoreductase [Nesterenkonia ebinurensis]
MPLPTMRAAVAESFGGPDVLQVRKIAVPEIATDEVLVQVAYAGLQPADAATRAGWVPPGAAAVSPLIPGNEFSGTIAAIGKNVSGFELGDPVLGFRVFGCSAEYVAVPASQVIRKPAALPWDVAGALSASGQTAHTALEALSVTAGETVIVHGAAGGVGTIFVQLALRAGTTVIGTAGAENQDYLHSLGAVAVEYGTGQLSRLRAAISEHSGSGRADAVLDAAGHGSLRTAVELVADRSRIGSIAEPPLADELGGLFIRSQRSAERLYELAELTAKGYLTVPIRHRYRLEEIVEAHRAIEAGHGRGKMVLEVHQPQDMTGHGAHTEDLEYIGIEL